MCSLATGNTALISLSHRTHPKSFLKSDTAVTSFVPSCASAGELAVDNLRLKHCCVCCVRMYCLCVTCLAVRLHNQEPEGQDAAATGPALPPNAKQATQQGRHGEASSRSQACIASRRSRCCCSSGRPCVLTTHCQPWLSLSVMCLILSTHTVRAASNCCMTARHNLRHYSSRWAGSPR